MSDLGLGTGAPLLPTDGASLEGAGGEDDAPVTRAELAAYEQRQAGRIETGLRKVQAFYQSHSDKSTNALRGEMREQLGSLESVSALLKDLGHELPPELVERAQSVLQRRVLSGAGNGTTPAPADGTPAPLERTEVVREPAPGPALDPKIAAGAAAAVEIMQEYGVVIEPNDPEYRLLNLDTEYASVFLPSVEVAAKAKAQRLGLPIPGAQPNDQASARIPGRGGPSGRAIPEGASSLDMFRLGYEQSDKRRSSRR